MNETLVLERIFKNYGKVIALSDMNLRVKEREILGLVGPNGAGKTTTLKIISTILKPDAGVVRVGGIDAQTESNKAKRLIGYLPDLPLLNENLSVLDTLSLFYRAWSIKFENTKAFEILNEYELKPLWSRRVKTLSKGQKQRLSLLCALLHNPKILLLDEVFTGLDIETREFLRKKLSELARQAGNTIVISSHDLGDVEKICNTIALIRQGKVVAYGNIREVKSKTVGNVFRLVLAKLPADIANFAEYAEDYSITGNTITFRLSEGKDANQVLKFFIERNCPIHMLRPLSLEEVLLFAKGGEL